MKNIGRYQIIAELGRGALGVVYRAADATAGREVALKVLPLSSAADAGGTSAREIFRREIRAAARLTHPSIVAIYDAFEDAETQSSCVAMEMVPGVTLEKILESPPPPTVEQSLDLLRQIAEALEYAHRSQVIHRDLKPANILVTLDGRAKISDFGLAKVLAREGMTNTGGVVGTPAFMSPEQVKGAELDARSDLFSFGIMAYLMLAGRSPFAGNTAAIMFKIVYEEPPVVSSLNPQLPLGYDYVVKRCLAKDVNRRYATARELLGDLEDLQRGRAPRSQAGAPALSAPAAAARPLAPPAMPPPVGAPVSTGLGNAPNPPAPVPPSPPAPPPTGAVPSPQMAPPPRPGPAPPRPAPSAAASPLAVPAGNRAGVMSSPGLIRNVPQPAPTPEVSAPRMALPAPVESPAQPAAAGMGAGRALAGQSPSMRPPGLAGVQPPAAPPASAAPAPPAWAPRPPAATAPPFYPGATARAVPADAPAVSPSSAAGGAQAGAYAPPLAPGAAPYGQLAESPEPATIAPKPNLIPIMLGGVGVVLLAGGCLVYWGIHRVKNALPAPASAPVASQAPVATPPVTPPAETAPTPEAPPAAPPEVPPAATPVPAPATAPQAPKKPAVRKAKPTVAPAPPTPAPAPAAPEPAPAVAVTPPLPAPAAPSAEEVAKAEAARLASIPRVVQVLCNYGLKEATFVFSGAGKTLFEETLKGKKTKGGFLGIKGSYQGTFTHTITVPAGVGEVSVRVVARDGSVDLAKPIKMPAAGGFVPTLTVEVDNDHLALNWKNASPSP